MSEGEPFGQGGRVLTAAALVGTLVGLLIWYGSATPGLFELVAGGRPEFLTPVFETVFPLTDRSADRAPWETLYMVAISFVSGVWVTIRFVQGWRFDREQLAFVPRTHRRSLPLPWERSTRSSESDHESETQRGGDDTRHGGVRDA